MSGLELTQEQGRARIHIQSDGNFVTVTRTHPSGRVENVRGMVLLALSAGQAVGWDWELPIGVPVVYTAYAYDADGNLIQQTSPQGTTTFSYNDENRLVGATSPGGNWQYVYDGLGNRVATTANGAAQVAARMA